VLKGETGEPVTDEETEDMLKLTDEEKSEIFLSIDMEKLR
jgi:hypothetical protein